MRPVPRSRKIPSVKEYRKSYAEVYWNPIYSRYRIVIFVDENPISLRMMRNCGRALGVEIPNIIIQNSGGHKVTMILAVNAINVVSCEAVLRGVSIGMYSITFYQLL